MGNKIHQLVAGWFGYRLIKKDKVVEVSHAPGEHLKLLLNHLKIDHVLDVGANIGQYATGLRNLGYTGKITSFEPVEACFNELLERSSTDPLWHVYHCALGSKNSKVAINVSIASAFSSFLSVNDYADKRYKRIQSTHKEMVPVKRLDDMLEEVAEPGDRIYLKLDTQGFDLEVFAGCSGCIDRILGMQSEISVTPIYDNMPDYVDSLTVFRDAGFHITGLYPIAWDEPTMRVIEFDCYMRTMT